MAELSDRKRRAIEALLTSKSTTDAAAQSGIGVRTIERWKRDPPFQDAYREASRACLSETVGRLRAAAGDAVETLRAALQDELTSNRIRAAIALLDTAVKVEVDDVVRRVDALEAAAGRSR
jgi:transposase